MKMIIRFLNTTVKTACKWCHGLGYRELGNDTVECDKCGGKGIK